MIILKNKKTSVSLTVFANMVDNPGAVASSIPLGGPLTVLFFSGLESFINTMGKKKKELTDESEKIFELTTKLSQFAHDQSEVEHVWETVTREPSEMNQLYDSILSLDRSHWEFPLLSLTANSITKTRRKKDIHI